MTILTGAKQTLRGRYDQLQKFLPLDDSLAVLKVVHQLPDLTPALVEIDQAVAAIPEPRAQDAARAFLRSEEHTSELQSLMRNSYAVFCLKKKRQPSPTQCATNTLTPQTVYPTPS